MGGIGAAGLGMSASPDRGTGGKWLLLALIPLIAPYCDAVGRDFDLRIALIARFLRREKGPFPRYEDFVAEAQKGWWLVGLVANLGASIIACTLVFLVGWYLGAGCTTEVSQALMVSAVLGALLVASVEGTYVLRLRALRRRYPLD